MNLKQFLKPDKKKIVITVFSLYFVFLVILFFTTSMEVYCTFESFKLYPEQCGWQNPILGIELDLNSAFLTSIILSYLISCFIIRIYDKFRKKY